MIHCVAMRNGGGDKAGLESTEPWPTKADPDEEPMARMRPDPQVGIQLAEARVLGAMFGHDSVAATFDRFRVLHRIGAGGMGVVYEAYDPDLARGVALKVVNVATKDRETALAEARSLARLSHPNVVAIYDVGIDGDDVYLAMELVRGKTLRQWQAGRGPLEICQMYRQAGEALAAMHDAGLVHRDFKPDNAIVGADGRVRVVDFGLACEVEDPERTSGERRAAGTPRFMAPEIKARGAVLPAADQYSFCVALAEALDAASAPAPRWMAAVLERGRAAEPAKRFASMRELLRALTRDPGRRWRRASAAGMLVAAAAALLLLTGQRNASNAEPRDVCEEGAAELAGAWSPAARAVAMDRLVALGPYAASMRDRLERGLEEHAARWVPAYHDACQDRRSQRETEALSDRRTACLERGRDALRAVGALIERASVDQLAELPRAVQAIPDPTTCSDWASLVSDVEPPPRAQSEAIAELEGWLAQARIQLAAGRYQQARDEAQIVVDVARTVGYAPLLAEALLAAGHAQMMLDGRNAVPILAEATTVAMDANTDDIAVEAWARRAYSQGTLYDHEGALAGLDVIEPLARRTRTAGFARALLRNNIGAVEMARGHRDKARAAFERAVAESQQIRGAMPIELVGIRSNLALVTEDRAEADRHLTAVADDLASRLGREHPDTLAVRWLRGTVTIVELDRARAHLVEVCRGYDLHPILVEEIARCWGEVGLLQWELGQHDEALAAFERAARAGGTAFPQVGPYGMLLQDDARGAARQFADLLAERRRTPDEAWWQRRDRGELLLGLGRAHRKAGNLGGARTALAGAVSDFSAVVGISPIALNERRLGRAWIELALTLSSLGVQSVEIAPIARAAVAWIDQANVASAERVVLVQLLARDGQVR
jgi:eukaryotic-like serine/threonine-protein kinase